MGLGIPRRFRTQSALRCNPALVVECVVPDLLHVIPVHHDNMLDGILLRQDMALAPSLVTDVTTFLHADQNVLHLGIADYG